MRDPAAPFVTYYDVATSERVELSWTTFDNWVAKTANLLRDELGVEPGATINVRLPLHWVLPVWLAASWRVGATVQLGSEIDPPDVAVIGPDLLATDIDAGDVVVCSLLPMAQGFADRLPGALIDYFSDVRNHGDHFAAPTLLSPEQDALIVGTQTWTAAGLELTAAGQAQQWHLPTGGRLLAIADDHSDVEAATVAAVMASLSVPASAEGSVVLVRHLGSAAADAIAAQERVTASVTIS